MSLGGWTVVLCALGCALLAGCGSSSQGTPVVPVPHKTADIAAISGRQSTAVAVANATSVAVQHIAQTAVARLQSTSTTQTKHRAAANAQATAAAHRAASRSASSTASSSGSSSAPVAAATPVVHILPTSLPAAHATHRLHHIATSPVRSLGIVPLVSIRCCSPSAGNTAAERTSKTFAVNGA